MNPLRTKSPWRRAELWRAALKADVSVSSASRSESDESLCVNRLARRQLMKLKIYAGAEHPHAAQAPKPLEVDE